MKNTVTTLTLFVLVIVVSITQPVFAEQTDAKDNSPTEGRIVHFPTDRCIGTLYIQDEGIENRHSTFRGWVIGLDEPRRLWRYFSPAQGDVSVPVGKRLRLSVHENEWKDLSPLQKLRPDDLYSLHLPGNPEGITNPDDRCVPHIAHLTGLKELDIDCSNISDRGLKKLEVLSSLERLYLPPRVSDEGMVSAAHLKSLKGLYFIGIGKVSNNGFAHLEGHPNLEEIVFVGSKVNSKVLRELAKLPSLKCLSLYGPNFTDDGLIYLKDFPSLKTLLLPDTNITDAGLQHFSDLHQLENLSLFNTQVTDAGIAHLVPMKSLRKLSLTKRMQNKTRITEKAFPLLPQISKLEYLYVNGHCINDYTLSKLSKLSNFKSLEAAFYAGLDRQERPLTDEGFRHLAKIQTLERLSIIGIKITDEGMEHLGELTNMKSIFLSGFINITHKGFSQLSSLRNLENLDFEPRNDNLTVSDISALNKLTNLKKLSLDGIIQDNSGLDISALKNLEELKIYLSHSTKNRRGRWERASLNDNDLACMENLTSLKRLYLGPNDKITDKGLMHLKGLTELNSLELNRADLSDDGLPYFKDMHNLTVLRIGGSFTPKALEHLKGIKSLSSLYINSEQPLPSRAIRDLKKSLPNLWRFQLNTK
jgi:hypothetical protein